MNINYTMSYQDTETIYNFSYERIHASIGTFICLKRDSDFDIT